MLDVTKKFELGNTVYFECLYRNINGLPTDPNTPAWTITNTKGDTVASGSPYKRADGIWYFLWEPTTTGDYLLTFTGYIEENKVTIRRKFKIIKTKLK